MKMIARMAIGLSICIGLSGGIARGNEDGAGRLACLDVRDMTMGEFAALLSRSGELQVAASEAARSKSISIFLRDVTSEEALHAVCRSVGLVVKDGGDGISQVLTREEVLATRGLYNDETVKTVQLRYATVADVGESLRNLFADRVVWVEPSSRMGDAENAIEKALDRMDQLADRGQNFGRGDGGGGDDYEHDAADDDYNDEWDSRGATGQASLGMMKQYRDALRERQLEDGAGASLEMETVGLVFLSAFPSTNMLLLRSSDDAALEQILAAVEDLDRPTPQVLLEVKVLELELGDAESTGVDWLFQDADYHAGSSVWQNGSIQNRPAESVGGGADSAILDDFNAAAGFNPRTAVLGMLDEHIVARLRLLQAQGRLKKLATPTLLVANDEASRVFIGSRSKFLESVERSSRVVVDGGEAEGGDLTPNIAEEDIGMNLLITPRIHADRSVTLRILQEETAFGDKRTIDYGEGVVDVQDILQRSVVSTIVGQHESWLVIGGLVRTGESEKESGVPVLRSLPLLGPLFRSSGISRLRTELIIMIRPFVLVAPGEEAPASQALLDRISEHPEIAPAKENGGS